MFSDYQCECGLITNYRKPYGESFPEKIKCECGSMAKRTWSGVIVDIAKGFDGITYKPSHFSPLNKVFGGGRMAGVESDFD